MRVHVALLLLVLPITSAEVAAADLGYSARATAVSSCPARGRPTVLSAGNYEAIQAEVGTRYMSAVEESELDRTVYNRSPRIMWAFAARSACGIALGYLKNGEYELDRLWNCECYYNRMVSYLPAGLR
jgi:hypothetical protein